MVQLLLTSTQQNHNCNASAVIREHKERYVMVQVLSENTKRASVVVQLLSENTKRVSVVVQLLSENTKRTPVMV